MANQVNSKNLIKELTLSTTPNSTLYQPISSLTGTIKQLELINISGFSATINLYKYSPTMGRKNIGVDADYTIASGERIVLNDYTFEGALGEELQGDCSIADVISVEASGWEEQPSVSKRTTSISMVVFKSTSEVVAGNGTIAFSVPFTMNKLVLKDVIGTVHTVGSGNTTDIQIRKRRAGIETNLLSTKLTIENEYYVRDAIINETNYQILTGDQLYVDVDNVEDVSPYGLSITMTFGIE